MAFLEYLYELYLRTIFCIRLFKPSRISNSLICLLGFLIVWFLTVTTQQLLVTNSQVIVKGARNWVGRYYTMGLKFLSIRTLYHTRLNFFFYNLSYSPIPKLLIRIYKNYLTNYIKLKKVLFVRFLWLFLSKTIWCVGKFVKIHDKFLSFQ